VLTANLARCVKTKEEEEELPARVFVAFYNNIQLSQSFTT